MADSLKDKCLKFNIRWPKMMDFLKQSRECQDEVHQKVQELEKRIATLDGEDKWMDHSSEFSRYINGYKGKK